MEKIKEFKEIILNLIKLSLPILGGNLSHILVSFANNIVAGRYSTVVLGAISVASAIVMTVTIGAIGLILSVSPVVSNLRGQKIPAKKYFKSTILFSILAEIMSAITLGFTKSEIVVIAIIKPHFCPQKDLRKACLRAKTNLSKRAPTILKVRDKAQASRDRASIFPCMKALKNQEHRPFG